MITDLTNDVKKKRKNKTQALIEFFREFPDETPSAAVSLFRSKGVALTGPTASRARQLALTGIASPSNQLVRAKKFVNSVGGVANVKYLISAIEQISHS